MIFSKHSGYLADGRRLYHNGGDGGADQMREMEEDRQKRINAAIATINDVFDPAMTKKGVNVATKFDPAQTYYNANGTEFDLNRASKGLSQDASNDDKRTTSGLGFNKTMHSYNNYGLENTALNSGSKGGGESHRSSLDGQTKPITPLERKLNEMISRGELFTGIETYQPENKRENLYRDQREVVYDLNTRDINRQYGEAERDNRFGLARNGLTGGSADVDSNARLQEITNEGLMKASGIADTAANGLRSADERARQSLISMAQSGIDTGSAQQMALESLKSTSEQAQGARTGALVGDLFGGVSKAYLKYKNPNNNQEMYINQYGLNKSAPQNTYQGS